MREVSALKERAKVSAKVLCSVQWRFKLIACQKALNRELGDGCEPKGQRSPLAGAGIFAFLKISDFG